MNRFVGFQRCIVLTVLLCSPAPAGVSGPRKLPNRTNRKKVSFAAKWTRAVASRLQDKPTAMAKEAQFPARRYPDRQICHLPSLAPNTAESGVIQDIRREHAAALWQIAQLALRDGDWEFAFQVAHEVVSSDPSHQAARNVARLGRTESKSTVRRMSRRQPVYGWPARRHWRGESAHFVIESNASEAAVRDLAEDLEVLHVVWRQLFVSCWAQRRDIEGLFAGRNNRLLPRRHRVVLFAGRDEYDRHLLSREPQVAMTLGMYRPADAPVVFFCVRR